jgi:hypothetical protein
MINSYCKINHPHVISEVIDGEAIIVNLESGAYFSLRGTGGFIWNLIEQKAAIDAIHLQLVAQYDGNPKIIESDMAGLVDELEMEKLITILPLENALPMSSVSVLRPEKRLFFEKPVLAKYTDMAELLLLDPIHDVEEIGWPHPANPNQGHSA